MDIIEKDIQFIITMAHKYHTNISSWYWREISETKEQWLQKRYKLSMKKGYYTGIIHVNNIDIKYHIPIPINGITPIKIIKQDETIYSDYNNLYKDVETLVIEQKTFINKE